MSAVANVKRRARRSETEATDIGMKQRRPNEAIPPMNMPMLSVAKRPKHGAPVAALDSCHPSRVQIRPGSVDDIVAPLHSLLSQGLLSESSLSGHVEDRGA
jgi:hypothetical protein